MSDAPRPRPSREQRASRERQRPSKDQERPSRERQRKRPARDRAKPAPLLRCQELTKDFGDTNALGPVSLTVERGEAVALVGHNGSGKSTWLSLIAGLSEPSGGTVEVSGANAGQARARASVTYLPDAPILYDDLSLQEHLDYLSRLHGTSPELQGTPALLAAFGLESRVDDPVANYSRGLRQKAAIVIGVCRPYDLLLVDEPFSGLDRAGRETLLELLGQVRDQQGSVVVATHDAGALEAFDRVVTLEHGRIVEDTRPVAEETTT